MKKKACFIFVASMAALLLFSDNVRAEAMAKLQRIRIGQHVGFTRLVLDSEGAKPLSIGPVSAKGLTVVYEQLEVAGKAADILRKKGGAVKHVSLDREDGRAVFTVVFKYPNTEVRTFYIKGDPPARGAYMLVLDFYPGISTAASSGKRVPFETAQPVLPVPKAEPTEPEEEASEEQSFVNAFMDSLSGEVSLIARPYISGDDESSKFTEYRDFNTVTGEWSLRYEKEDQYFFETNAENVGQDDQYYDARGGWYGKIKAGISYDEIPHRYAFDARSLYGGIGSDNLLLNDALQTDLQGLAGDPIAQANRLISEFPNSAKGDPEIKRKKLSMDVDFISLEPFSFRAEFRREKQDGTRPFFGSFSLDNTVEIFEPIDNETIDIKFIAEYAKRPYFLNATYYYQDFENNENTLTFDNPFRIDDAVGGPSQGLIDLAPDNYYHNISLSGSYMDLPFKSRISAIAAWGWMRQDDKLVAFTINPAIDFPIDYSDPANLPTKRADAKVNTSLYDLSLNSRPLDYMRLKGRFRYYDYDNDSDRIFFPDGYVETDAFPEPSFLPTLINTLPSSYRKIKADINLGFDIWTRTRLNLDYRHHRTDRDNREVERQDDHIYGGSVDTSPSEWLDLRTSYERTERDIDNYDFDVYLDGGQDLDQLPELRKYDQADVSRDRAKFLATFYPTEPLAFSSAFTYGKDDYNDSDFGLTDSKYYNISLDADFAVTDRLQLNAFYSYEKYENEQKGRGEFDGGPIIDWNVDGTDEISTFGGGIKFAVIPDRLDFALNFSYSKVDGDIDFDVADGSAEDFDTVDETELYNLDTSLTYNIFAGYYVSLGYYWEKFDYDDYNTEGFAFVPVDDTGAFNGAILSGTLPEDYNTHIFYTTFTIKF